MIRLLRTPLLCLACASAAQAAIATELDATLGWSGKVALTLSVPGVLERVEARPGQRVRQGELLAALDATLYKAGVAEARAEMDRLSEELAEATRELERAQELYARTITPTSEFDAAKLRHARARTGHAAAQARVERARRLLAESELRAPFDAIVLARQGEPGLVIQATCQPAQVLTLARADELHASATLSPTQARTLQLDTALTVDIGGQSFAGKVAGLTALDSGGYRLDVALPRGSGMLAGQAASIRLP